MKSEMRDRSPLRRTLIAATLLASMLWAVSPTLNLAVVPFDVASGPPAARGDAGASVFVPGQAPTAAPDHALLSATDIERSMPRTFGPPPALSGASA